MGTTALVVGAFGAGAAVWLYQCAQQSNVGELAFTNRLAIPRAVRLEGHEPGDVAGAEHEH